MPRSATSTSSWHDLPAGRIHWRGNGPASGRFLTWIDAAERTASDQLDRQRRAFAPADAQAGDAALETLLLERVEQRDEDPSAARANRVAERGRAAVDVDLVVRDADVAHREHRHAGERLVHFPQVDVLDRPSGLVEHLADGAHGSGGEVLRLLRVRG